jgi:hypothetical protein
MNLTVLWKAWGEVLLRLLAAGGSLASLLGLVVPFLRSQDHLPWWGVALLLSATFFFILLLILEIRARRGRRVYAKNDPEGIRRYMHDWIEHGGRAVIWTRDLSWADNPQTRGLLEDKAKRKELTLCLPERNQLAKDLEKHGAEVCAYGAKHLQAPASRFTIIFFGRGGARLAVGRAEGDTHVIEEFDDKSHPAFYLAQDLIAVVRSLCPNQPND